MLNVSLADIATRLVQLREQLPTVELTDLVLRRPQLLTQVGDGPSTAAAAAAAAALPHEGHALQSPLFSEHLQAARLR